jgi:hypothetical protein
MAPALAHAFLSIEEAAQYLRGELRDGDLVLLRGRHSDHLSRLYLAQVTDVRCWRTWCAKRGLCDDCAELTRVSRNRLIRVRRATEGWRIPANISTKPDL